MIFGKKSEENLVEQLTQRERSQSYWSMVKKRFRKNRLAMWSLRVLILLSFIALFSDFIANEKPLYCKIEGKTYFPVLKQYAVDLGFSKWDAKFYQTDWRDHNYERVIMPLIPYSHFTRDKENYNFTPPSRKHWMGTEKIGYDVAAGMVRGTRIALLVGIISMFVATLIGMFLGSLAGFFGDNRFQISRGRLWLNLFGIFLAYFYGFHARSFALNRAGEQGTFGWEILKSLFIIFVIILLLNLLANLLKRISFFAKKVTVPFDLIVMRLIEIMNSIPALFLLLAAVSILEQPSIISVMVIIGLIRWTTIARFIRAELLRVRSLEYVEAAQAMGFSDWRIILRHAIPNSIGPVLITIAFGVASAILIEAFISFLGIGLGNEVTWGKLLSWARESTTAWWLAVFPGIAIFITVTVFNLIGDGLTEALDPKSKK